MFCLSQKESFLLGMLFIQVKDGCGHRLDAEKDEMNMSYTAHSPYHSVHSSIHGLSTSQPSSGRNYSSILILISGGHCQLDYSFSSNHSKSRDLLN